MNISSLVKEAHSNAVQHGWWDNDRSTPECLALIHSEVSEALEEYRNDKPPVYSENGKPEGIVIELADVVIRVADLCGRHGYDLEEAIAIKMRYNESRPYRHGGKKA